MSYIYGTNLPLIRTGFCYLKRICEKTKDRFEKSIDSLIQNGFISIADYEAFDMTSELLIFCDMHIYRHFLELAKTSCTEDVRQSCAEDLEADCSDYQKAPWYIYLCEEYAEFKKMLGID